MSNQGRSARSYLLLALGLSGVTACAGVDDARGAREDTESTATPIIDGQQVMVDALGTPRVMIEVPAQSGHFTLCSGVMLSDQWLLTAHHCVTLEDVRQGGTIVDPSTITVTAFDHTAVQGAQVFPHPSVDVALVRLNGSLLNAAGRPFANPLYLGSATSLAPGPINCRGWGFSTFDGGAGDLREATMPVASADTNSIRLVPNNLGQIPFSGDSGGPCFMTIDGVPRVVGITSHGHLTATAPVDTLLVSIDAFRDWAEGMMGNAATLFSDAGFAGRAQALVPGGPFLGTYDYFRLLVGNDAVSSLTVPPQWYVNLYRDSGFRQLMPRFTATTDWVGASYNDQASSAFVNGGVMLYQDSYVQSLLLPINHAGHFELPAGVDKAISSLTVPMGWRVRLFENHGYSGASVTFEEGTHLFVGADFNDRASSVIVEQPVEVYVDPNYNGAMGRLLPGPANPSDSNGCYGWNALGVPNDSISSIFVPDGVSVRVYRDGIAGAPQATFTTSQSSLPTLNDQISGICVDRLQ